MTASVLVSSDRIALCELYKPRLEEGLAYLENPNAKGYGDFRKMYENKDIDRVVVANPDHWHAMLTIMACAAGKDVSSPFTNARNNFSKAYRL